MLDFSNFALGSTLMPICDQVFKSTGLLEVPSNFYIRVRQMHPNWIKSVP